MTAMPLRCWRIRLAYRAVFLLCISWYAVQLIQTCFLSSQEHTHARYNDGTRKMPKLSDKPIHVEGKNAAMPRIRYGENRRKSGKLSGGSFQRKLNVVHTRKNAPDDIHGDQVFIQTNSSGITTKNVPFDHQNTTGRKGHQLNGGGKETSLPHVKMRSTLVPEEVVPAINLSTEETARSKRLFQQYQYNVVVSDKIALDRDLPDDRPARCKAYRYPDRLPPTSIIIAFHNEAKSTFLRTIHSIINRSPRHLVTEIILVNDASNLDDWHQSPWIYKYLANLSMPIHLLQSQQRLGVVGARLLGLSKVSNMSEVVTFLDSHCECTDGWLEPLLQRISKDRTRVVSPVVDSIDDHTFEYVSTISWPNIGGFSWFPEFMWIRVPPHEKKRVYGDLSLPLRTPTISGGLFAIDKRFFSQLGYYDPGLKIWGGENLELSFKAWLCGGSLEVVPCSRVGHVFRGTTPYSFLEDPEDVFLRNNRRILETWAQDYSHVFYALTPKYKDVQYGNVEDRQQLKEALKCHDFDWYLKNVYPGHILPQDFQHLGQIINQGTGLCLDNTGEDKKLGSLVVVTPCKLGGMNQIISWNRFDQLQHDRYCLTPQEKDHHVSLEFCALGKTTNARHQEWIFDEKTKHVVHSRTKQCLSTAESPRERRFIMIQNCSATIEQRWFLKTISLERSVKSEGR